MSRWMIVLFAAMLPAWVMATDVTGLNDAALKVSLVSPEPGQADSAVAEGQTSAMSLAKVGAYKAKYEVHYSGFKVGEMKQQFKLEQGGQMSLKTEAYTTGLASWLKSDRVVEQSTWSNSSGENLPISYTYQYKGQSQSIFEKLGFDWNAGTVSSLRDGKTVYLSAKPGTLDKHMLQIVLREDLLKGRGISSYIVADRNKIKQYKVEVVAKESVKVAGFGDLNCLKLKKGTTFFWVAEKLDYLPVKIEKDEGGSIASSHLIGYAPG